MRDRLLRLLLERSFRTGDFVLASGQRSRFYIDCRTTTMHAEGQALIGRLGLNALHDAGWAPDTVGGLTMGADPVAYAIAHASWGRDRPIHAFSVRKQVKQHGASRQIEGCFVAGQSVVVIEDVITSGGSALAACAALAEAGAEILGVLALVDRQGGGRAAIEAAGYPVTALLSVEELLASDGGSGLATDAG